jgi:lipopolysaccharide export LptBFGC system permease protein LptF
MPSKLPARGGTDWQRAQVVAVEATALRHRRKILAARYWRVWLGLPCLVVAVAFAAAQVGPWLRDHGGVVVIVAAVVVAVVIVARGGGGGGRGYRPPRELR